MTCTICGGAGTIHAHLFVMTPTKDYWRPMLLAECPSHMKHLVFENECGEVRKKCLCCQVQ